MKITALIPDELVEDVRQLSNGKNITEAMIIALSEWTATKKLQALNRKIGQSPLRFKEGFTAAEVRQANRKK